MSALHCTKWILVLVIDRYDLLVFCRPFSVCRVHCMKLVQTKPLLSGMSNCNHLLFVLALTFEWLVLPNESVSHNCTSPRIARGIKFNKRCSHTSLWFVWELPRIKSCIQHTTLYSGTLWPFVEHLAVLTEYKNVWKRTHQYAQNQEDIMKEATIFPSPPQKKKSLCPANSIRKMWSRSVNFRNMVKKEC